MSSSLARARTFFTESKLDRIKAKSIFYRCPPPPPPQSSSLHSLD
jgi:hypothetical protein